MSKPKVTIYTDGACANNPGAGGYGVILMFEDNQGTIHKKELSKGYKITTNNRMELLGVIDALSELKTSCVVKLYSDSKYVCDAINNGWISNWKKNGWKTAKKEPVKNQDLWMQLDELVNKHHCKFSWVKGHSDNELNNRCDDLLNKAMDNFDVNSINDVVVIEKDIDILKQLIKMRDELNDLISRLTT